MIRITRKRTKIAAGAAACEKEKPRDIVALCGPIQPFWARILANELPDSEASEVLFVLATYGGDPDTAYRIVRLLQERYERVALMVDTFCKSAGTLIATGADELIMSELAELGPLDMQLGDKDEIFRSVSSLDVSTGIAQIVENTMDAFRSYLLELHGSAKISTKAAGAMAAELATGLFAGVMAQVEPRTLGETGRAINIASQYGHRLQQNNRGNLRDGALQILVLDYPSHSFVIDRREARTLFVRVRQPTEAETLLANSLKKFSLDPRGDVSFYVHDHAPKEVDDQESSESSDGEGRNDAEPAASERTEGSQDEEPGSDDA